MAEMEAKLKKKKKLCSLEILIKECMKKSDEALAQKVVVEKRAVLAEEEAHQAVEEYKKSTFEDEMIEAGMVSYEMGFTGFQDKVAKLYSDLDLLGIIMAEEDEEGDSEQ